MKVLYTASATARGAGRGGQVATDDLQLDLKLAVPPEMGGPGGATNPEQLFAAGYSACFHSALQLVARKARADLGDSTVTARVGIGPKDNGYGLVVDLDVAMPGLDQDTATQLAEQAHQVCPYSNATRGNITVTIHIVKE